MVKLCCLLFWGLVEYFFSLRLAEEKEADLMMIMDFYASPQKLK